MKNTTIFHTRLLMHYHAIIDVAFIKIYAFTAP